MPKDTTEKGQGQKESSRASYEAIMSTSMAGWRPGTCGGGEWKAGTGMLEDMKGVPWDEGVPCGGEEKAWCGWCGC